MFQGSNKNIWFPISTAPHLQIFQYSCFIELDQGYTSVDSTEPGLKNPENIIYKILTACL